MVLSPDIQKDLVLTHFVNQTIEWEDIAVVPDFVKFFSPFTHKITHAFSRYKKNDYTQVYH